MNPETQGNSGSVTETSGKTYGENHKTTDHCSQNDPHPERRVSKSQFTQLSGPDGTYDMVTGVRKEIRYSSPGTSSSTQKESGSESKQQIRSENTLETIGEDQMLLALQQLASNSNSATFNNKIHQFSKFQSPSPQQCPHLTGTPRSMGRLKTFSKHASKITTT